MEHSSNYSSGDEVEQDVQGNVSSVFFKKIANILSQAFFFFHFVLFMFELGPSPFFHQKRHEPQQDCRGADEPEHEQEWGI